MGDDDVPHVVTAKAKPLNLIDGDFVAIEYGTDESSRRSEPARGIGAVPRPEARVYEYQTIVGLDEKHVAHQLAAPERK
jgi:hypothetical protein